MPFQKVIKSGHSVLEALQPGVTLHTLKHFFDIDDFVAVRPFELKLEQKREYILNGFNQIGKAYDYNFDVETNERIVCSEVIYAVFDNLRWNTNPVVGRNTITPDDVARSLVRMSKGSLEMVLFYEDGKLISEKNRESYNLFKRVTE